MNFAILPAGICNVPDASGLIYGSPMIYYKSMKLFLKQGNILDVEADILVCSANISLTMTGGVGADITKRYGTQMQHELHSILRKRRPHFAHQGEVVTVRPPGLPYKAVIHAVAVDPLYQSSPEVIEFIMEKVFSSAQSFDAEKIALTALATGFGNLSLEEFAEGLRPHLNKEYPPLKEIVICQIEDYRFKELREAFPEGLLE